MIDEKRFQITDIVSAMWIADELEKAKDELESKSEKAKEIRDLRIQQAKDYYDKEINKYQESVNRLEGFLAEYCQRQPDKVIDLPNIRVSLSKTKKYTYPTKQTDLLKIAKEYMPDTIQIKEEVKWSDIKDNLNFKDGKAITENGEVISGVSQREEEKMNFKIRSAK